jgi:SAM-dependent methyltransferase
VLTCIEFLLAYAFSEEMNPRKNNIDPAVVESFGVEWSKFSHENADSQEMAQLFESYFRIFPWDELPPSSEGFDLGCGTGRWARYVSQRVGTLHCIDPSAAIDVARQNLKNFSNVHFHRAGVDEIPLADDSADFGYSLGVLHHVPSTADGIVSCVRKLKPGAPFLIYLYYKLDNRPWLFRMLWHVSNGLRKVVSRLPHALKTMLTDVIAALVYLPLARFALLCQRLGMNIHNFPLSAYSDKSFYVMRTDALDRFGTTLEQRFSKAEIFAMMTAAGLENIRFGEEPPYWCAVGTRKLQVAVLP